MWQLLLVIKSNFYFLFLKSGGEDEPMSDNEFSRDGDSPDALSRVPPSDVDPETLQKLREQVSHQFYFVRRKQI